jgi:regulator of sigma E protease
MFSIWGSLPQSYTLANKPIFMNEIRDYEKSSKVKLFNEGSLTIEAVGPKSLAENAGLKRDDTLSVVGSDTVNNLNSLEDFKKILNKYKGQKFQIIGSFGTKEIDATNIIKENENVVLGIATGYKVQRQAKDFFGIFSLAFSETGDVIKGTFDGLGKVFSAFLPSTQDKSALGQVSGPIGIGSVSGLVFSAYGIQGLVYLMATLSIALGVFNALPIPALDGGRFIIITLSQIFGRRNKKWETIAISVTFLLLIGMSLLVTGNDIWKLIPR